VTRALVTRALAASVLVLSAACGGSSSSSTKGPDVSAMAASAQAGLGPCDRIVAAGATFDFDLMAEWTPDARAVWNADSGTLDPAVGYQVTWTAPATPGTAHVTVIFQDASGLSAPATYPMQVEADQASADAAQVACRANGP